MPYSCLSPPDGPMRAPYISFFLIFILFFFREPSSIILSYWVVMYNISVTVSLSEDWATLLISRWDGGDGVGYDIRSDHILLQTVTIKNIIQENPQPIPSAGSRTEFQMVTRLVTLPPHWDSMLNCAVKLYLIRIPFGWHSFSEHTLARTLTHAVFHRYIDKSLPVVVDVVVVGGPEIWKL